jgi:hypothetical protein
MEHDRGSPDGGQDESGQRRAERGPPAKCVRELVGGPKPARTIGRTDHGLNEPASPSVRLLRAVRSSDGVSFGTERAPPWAAVSPGPSPYCGFGLRDLVSTLSIPSSRSARDGQRFVLDLDRRLERFDQQILVADWDLFTGRSSQGSAPWQLKRAALLSDPRLLEWARSRRHDHWPTLLRRRLELLERVLIDTQLEQDRAVVRLRSDLQRRIVAYRPRWRGKRVNRAVIHRVLREDSRPADRHRAYRALEPLHRSLEGKLVALVRLRNERARAFGFPTFAAMRLGFEGVTPARLEELSEQALAIAPSRLRALQAQHIERSRASGWYPWDFWFALEQQARLPTRLFTFRTMVPRILRALARWGLPTSRMRFRVVFHDLPAGGLTLAPDPPRDIRILVHPQGGWQSYNVMFHEVGHAIHSASIRAPRHLLRWHENVPGFGGLHEGIGGFFERVATDSRWLATVPGLDVERANAFAAAHHDSSLLWAASIVSWMRVEQALYRNPDRDPRPEAHRFDRRLFGYDEYEPLSFVDSFFVESPVYAPNYLLANLFQAQLVRAARAILGDPFWPNPRIGPWLKREWFVHGSLYDWIPRVRKVTGRPFDARAFRSEFGTVDS